MFSVISNKGYPKFTVFGSVYLVDLQRAVLKLEMFELTGLLKADLLLQLVLWELDDLALHACLQKLLVMEDRPGTDTGDAV